MLVQNILKGKQNHEVATIPSGATVAEAAEVLSAKHIGALVVSDDGESVIGMFSERDIVRELGRKGAVCLGEKVSELMSTTVKSCTKDETAVAVLRKMTEGRFRHMPVMEARKMIGLISIGDAVQARLSEITMEKEALEGMIKGF